MKSGGRGAGKIGSGDFSATPAGTADRRRGTSPGKKRKRCNNESLSMPLHREQLDNYAANILGRRDGIDPLTLSPMSPSRACSTWSCKKNERNRD